MGNYSYHKPKTLCDALTFLNNDGSYVLAGGTDLLVHIHSDKIRPNEIIDIKGLNDLKGINDTGDYIRVGPLTTVNELLEHTLIKPYKALLDGCAVLGCHEIRHRATIGGNICNASPSGDTLIPLLLFEPKLIIKGFESKREINIQDFFAGTGKTILNKGELLTDILLPLLPKGFMSLYRRKTRVKGMDLSSIGMALSAKPSLNGYFFLWNCLWSCNTKAYENERSRKNLRR